MILKAKLFTFLPYVALASIISFPCSSYGKSLSFTLIDSDCKMFGPMNSKIDTNNNASKTKSYCQLTSEGNKVQCSTIDPTTDKFISNHTYTVAIDRNTKGTPTFLIGLSESGNINFAVDFINKNHQWGQVNFLASGKVVVAKYCIGNVQLK